MRNESRCDGMADVRGVGIIMFDRNQLDDKGLQYLLIDKQKRQLYEHLQTVWDTMVIKRKEPPLLLKPVPTGWVEASNIDGPMSSSSPDLSADVQPISEPVFRVHGSRNPGGVTYSMKEYRYLRVFRIPVYPAGSRILSNARNYRS